MPITVRVSERRIRLGAFALVLALCPSLPAIGQGHDVPNWDVYEESLLDVKFLEGTRIRLRNGRPQDVSADRDAASEVDAAVGALGGATWRRAHSVSEATLEEIRNRGLARSGGELPDLELYQRVTLPPGLDAYQAKQILLRSPIVEGAYYVPKPPPPPVAPDYSLNTTIPYQSYLDAAPNGIDARYAWSLGWTGFGISICDVEYDFNGDHADLPHIARLGGIENDPFADNNHGTAVFGEMLGLNDGVGVRGVSYDAGPNFFSPALTVDAGYSVARALVECIAALEAGDVILIEQQTAGPNYTGAGQLGLVPTEWDKPVYDAIRTAVANDIVVVETTGNGAENLDAAAYSTGHDDHWPFLLENDSGAILVTGGTSTVPHSQLSFTNFGATVDLQGWGHNIVTTGYGDLYGTDGVNAFYTQAFGGSSGAGPIVAGAVAALQSGYKALTGTVLPAAQVRSILRSTGTPGGGLLTGVPLPDLQAAIDSILDVIYVDDTAGGANDGSSWTDAYTWLPDALAAATPGTVIMVAEGFYFPAFLDGPRTDTLALQSGVALLGGFPNGGGTRDPEAHPTVLSGNISAGSMDSYHVVTGSGTDPTAVLNGFTVSLGNADGTSPHDAGAGVLIQNGSPTIQNVVFSSNSALFGGGAFVGGGNPTFVDVRFEANTATDLGGGLYNSLGDVLLNRVTFIDNEATGPSAEGGGFFSTGGGSAGTTPLAYDVRFYNNTAFRGGAISNWPGSELRVDNAIFSGNSASDIGGAVLNFSTVGSLRIHNATFAGNQTPGASGALYAFDPVTIENSVVWDNGSSPLAGSIAVSDSLVEGGFAGTNNISDDPLFRDADGADATIGTEDDDLRLAAASPAIDTAGASCTGTDIQGHNRIGTCDRGAHEYLGDPGTLWSNGEVDQLLTVESYDQTLLAGPIRQSADDFEIPIGEACDITSVRSVLADPTETVEAKLEIYGDAGGVPGSLITSDTVGDSPDASLGSLRDGRLWEYRFDITPLRLGEGTWWVSVYGQQESATTNVPHAVSAGEGTIQGNPHQFRQVGFGWVDGGVFAGHGSHDLALDVDANCGCGTDSFCDDADVDTLDTCTNLVCSNVVPPAPPNDEAANAIVVTAGTTLGTLLGASNDGSSSVGLGGAKDVWYRYTAPSPLLVGFTTCATHDATSLDTVLSIHSGSPGTSGNELAANDDWPGSTTYPDGCNGIETDSPFRDSALKHTLGTGETVTIRVGQFSTSTNGDFELNVIELPEPGRVLQLASGMLFLLALTRAPRRRVGRE